MQAAAVRRSRAIADAPGPRPGVGLRRLGSRSETARGPDGADRPARSLRALHPGRPSGHGGPGVWLARWLSSGRQTGGDGMKGRVRARSCPPGTARCYGRQSAAGRPAPELLLHEPRAGRHAVRPGGDGAAGRQQIPAVAEVGRGAGSAGGRLRGASPAFGGAIRQRRSPTRTRWSVTSVTKPDVPASSAGGGVLRLFHAPQVLVVHGAGGEDGGAGRLGRPTSTRRATPSRVGAMRSYFRSIAP